MVECTGIKMYDIRTTIKAPAGETIEIGESCCIHTDGTAILVDDAGSQPVHGWALTAAVEGQEVTLVTTARLTLDTTQTIGARLYTGAVAGGSPPSTTFAATGPVCGFAITATLVFVNVPTPAADG